MASVEQQVRSVSDVICRNIDAQAHDRALLAQNILSQLRNLVEGLTVWAHTQDAGAEFDYSKVGPALDFVKSNGKLNFLGRFHKLLQSSVSHYTPDTDPSERLMLKYYEYLIRARGLARSEFGLSILKNLEKFPIDLDPSLRDYQEKIAARVVANRISKSQPSRRDRYYIQSSRPFFVDGRIYYEITFCLARNRTSKFDRIIAFTDIDVSDKYSANLELASDSIDVLGQTMPITIVRSWEVSIRPCEFDNFARFFDQVIEIRSSHAEYRNLMQYLTDTRSSLLDLMDMGDANYAQIRSWALQGTKHAQIFAILDKARDLVRAKRPGRNLLRYLMLRMNNQVIKAQFDFNECPGLSQLRVSWSCKPFDTMPLCTSPRGHNPRFADVLESLETTGREHELLARRVKNNVEEHGMIYTPAVDLERFGNVDLLIARYNKLLPPTHTARRMAHENGHVFIRGYEDGTVAIIEKLQEISASGVAGHSSSVQQWIDANPNVIDDDLKADALKHLFARSKVALIYGAAGTGKSTMVSHVAHYFASERKLFLAHTNPAVDNLKRRVAASNMANAEFSTISKHVRNSFSMDTYDVLVIDECSTVSNASLIKVLENTSFELLVLVGDVYQIESIEFGNWFGAIRSYIPQESVFELTKPFRTNDQSLLTLWDRVRNLDDRIEESLAKNRYSTTLGESLFKARGEDEIILCLNYDGLYGINNVNRFLQASNPSRPISWGASIYKVGDPVLFNEIERFRPIIFNNLKGKIVSIDRVPGRITFAVELDREVSPEEVDDLELRWLAGSTVQFEVFERDDSDADEEPLNTTIPFQIAYAVSIHKAQGLEYDSVKVVITDANETNITHARQHLEVFWTPETEKRILSRLELRENRKDEHLLQERRGVKPVAKPPKRQVSRRPI
jgi:hypothetical protein